VSVQGYVCHQSRIISVVDGLVESKVEGGVLEEELEICVIDAWVLREIGTVAGGAVDSPSVHLAIGCLLPQLPRDSQMRPKV
jgi:hypothetical protein